MSFLAVDEQIFSFLVEEANVSTTHHDRSRVQSSIAIDFWATVYWIIFQSRTSVAWTGGV